MDYAKMLRLLVSLFAFALLGLFQWSFASSESDDVVCGFPGAPAYGQVKPDLDAYDEEDAVSYTCRVGYILIGAPVRRCMTDGSWTEDVPICDDSMTTLGIAFSTPTVPGHNAEMAIDRNRDTCTYLKAKKPRWWRIDLGGLHKILSVAVTMISTEKYVKFTVYVIEIQGQSASYKRCASFSGRFGSQTIVLSCAEGKGLEGQRVHIEDHRQEDFFEICEVEVQVEKDTGYDCGRPDRAPYSMTYEPEDDEVEYSCSTGYELIGDSHRECQSTGQWSDEAPVCKPIVCETLEDLENGELTFSVEEGETPLEGTTAIYTCDYGYKLEGDITRLCLKDGSWSGKDPVCAVIRCPVPEGHHDGEIYRLVNRTNRVGCMAKLRCRGTGVRVGDDPYITCTAEGKWTEAKAECIQQGGASMKMKEVPIIVNRGGVIFGMVMAGIMMIIIFASFYIVKRRREANRPEIPRRQFEAPAPPPRPPPRAKGLRSALMDLVASRDSTGNKYDSNNLENGAGMASWKTRSLPMESGANDDVTAQDHGSQRRAMSYDDPEKVRKDKSQDESTKQPDERRVRTPVGVGDYAAVDYEKKRQSRLLRDSEDRSQGTSPALEGEKIRELPPIPKEEEEEGTRSKSGARSPISDKDKEEEKKDQDTEEAGSEDSEDVSLPIAPSDSQTSEAPTPSPDVVIENQVNGTSASPSTPPSESASGRRRRRGEEPAPAPALVQPPPEDAADTRRTRARRRAEPEEPETPPAPPPVEERPTRRQRQWETPSQPPSRRRY